MYYSTAAITFDTATAMDAEAGLTDFASRFKDISVSPPEGAVEMQNFLGEDSNGFQNASFEEKAFTAASMTGTMVLTEAEVLELFFGGAGTDITTTHTRYQYGTGASGKTRVKVGCIVVNIDNGTDEVNVAFNNIMFTKLGDLKITGVDGHWERSFEAVCLPADYYEEYKD